MIVTIEVTLFMIIQTIRRTVRAQVVLACQIKPTFHVKHRLSAVMLSLSNGTNQFLKETEFLFFLRMKAKAQFYQPLNLACHHHKLTPEKALRLHLHLEGQRVPALRLRTTTVTWENLTAT